jgi:hypothetical protein
MFFFYLRGIFSYQEKIFFYLYEKLKKNKKNKREDINLNENKKD